MVDSAVVARRVRAGSKPSRTTRLLAINLAVFTLFVLVMNVPFTGVPVHEWLGIGIAVFLGVHAVQHANWIVTTTRRLFRSGSFRNRLSYAVSIALFIGFATIVVSGLVISEVALPWIGVRPAPSEYWLWLHVASVVWVLWLTALHVALSWSWIVSTFKRLTGGSRRSRRAVAEAVRTTR